jgi:hypothetical protein
VSDPEDKEFTAESKKKELKVTIQSEDPKVDQLEAENKNLKSENADIKSQLETIADMEFVRQKEQVITRGRRVGLTINPESILEPENLISYAQIVKQRESEDKILNKGRPAGSGVPITGAQTGEDVLDQSGKRIEDRIYNSAEELIADMNKEHQGGNKTATDVLTRLTKKALTKKDFSAEFTGSLPKVAGQVDPIRDKGKSKEQLEAERRVESQKWRSED